MTRSVLVAYATKHGSTREVAEAVAATLREHELEVEVRPVGEVADLSRYGAAVLGAALYMGRVHADARRFIARNHVALAGMPFAVRAMGPRTLEAEDVSGSREQLDKALARAPDVEPVSVTIFGGVVDPEQLGFRSVACPRPTPATGARSARGRTRSPPHSPRRWSTKARPWPAARESPSGGEAGLGPARAQSAR
jgi:menaquinone-dependent protoporphyrinogen oxidase